MNVPTNRGRPAPRTAAGARRVKVARGNLNGLAGRAAAELERLRPQHHHHARRTRAESVLERVKHLV